MAAVRGRVGRLLALLLGLTSIDVVAGHGRLISPPSRACMWRYGFDNPKNYNDNQLFCGGRTVQWEKNKGKCGICGDAYDEPGNHTAGGDYANGIITGVYSQGQVMQVTIEVTANHGGQFEFRLCPLLGGMPEATETCLKRLSLTSGAASYHLQKPLNTDNFTVSLQLPDEVTCGRCVLQWTWITANSWGCDDNNKCCIGCGPQENFVNCADVKIEKPAPKPVPKASPWPAPIRKQEYNWDKPTVLFTDDGREVLLDRDSPRGVVSLQQAKLLTAANLPSRTNTRTPPKMATFSTFDTTQDVQAESESVADPYSGQDFSVNLDTSNTRQSSDTESQPSSRTSQRGSEPEFDPYGGQDYIYSPPTSTATDSARDDASVSVAGSRVAPQTETKTSAPHCEFSPQLDGVSVECERVCVPSGAVCNGKWSSAIMDEVCKLLCNVVI